MLWRQPESGELIRRVEWSAWAMIAAVMAVNVLLFGVRVRLVLQRLRESRIAQRWWQRIFVNAFALDLIFPQAGAIDRGIELKRRYDLDVLSYVRGYYFIAWFGVVFILGYGMLALPLTAIFGLVPITPGNIAVQELVIGTVGRQADLTFADGVVLSLFIRALRVIAIVMLFASLNGLVILRTGRVAHAPEVGSR